MSLAEVDDYTTRYDDTVDPAKLTQLLDDASSLVRQVANLTISLVEDDVVTLDDEDVAGCLLFLPELPVVSVASVVSDGTTLQASTYKVRKWGAIELRHGWWPCDADIVVTYTHGWDPVPDWIVSLVCSTVQRAVRPAAINGVQGVTAGSQNVQYASSLAGVNLWLTRAEEARLKGLAGPEMA